MNDVTMMASGLDGLARAGEKTWFHGHFGAGVLAGERLLRRTDFTEEVKNGIRDQIAKAKAAEPELFVTMEGGTPVPFRTRLIAALLPHVLNLSISGHGVIYGAMALQAMDEVPELASPARVAGIEKLLALALRDRNHRYYGIADYRMVEPTADFPSYTTTEAMAERSLAECTELFADRELEGTTYFFTAEKLHGVTLAHALLTLEKLGFRELVRKGLSAHRKALWLNRHRPPTGAAMARVRKPDVTPYHGGYWRKESFDDHGLKLAIAGLELVDVLSPEARARYFDPATFWHPFVRAV